MLEKVRFLPSTEECSKVEIVLDLVPALSYQAYAYPRGTGTNPVEGNGPFFPSCRQLYLSSFSDTIEEGPIEVMILGRVYRVTASQERIA